MNTPSTSTMEGFDTLPPTFSRSQLEYLQKKFPPELRPEHINLTDRELGALFGQQQVLTHLLGLIRQQEQDDNY